MYRVNKEKAKETFKDSLKTEITPGILGFLECTMEYVELAYEAGKDNEPLQLTFPWIEEVEEVILK